MLNEKQKSIKLIGEKIITNSEVLFNNVCDIIFFFFNFYRAMLRRARWCHATISRLSVRLSVTFRYDFYRGWNTSKIISRLISLRHLLGLIPTWAI